MRLLVTLFLGICFIVAAAASALVVDGLTDNVAQSDVIVILGNKVEADGTPSPRLKSRLDAGVNLYTQGISKRILVSGGTGVEGYDEAVAMREYLVAKRIPSEAIITDSQGVDSFATAKNTAAYLEGNNLHSVLAVSNYYHLPRTRLAFERAGIEVVYTAHANHFELRDVYSIARELIAYPYYLLRQQ